MQTKPKSKYPLVSIFCFCKNRMKSIRRCIDSIVAQDYPNIEIIVQDGGSTDGTLEILQGYGNKIKLVSEPDSGPPDGFFRALKRVRGEFFGSCLSDEELLPHAASWAVENLTKYPETAAIYGDFSLMDIDGNITSKKHVPLQWDFEKFLCSETTPPFSSSFFRRSCYEALGFREYTGVDEFDFWINLGAKFPIRYVPGLVSKYAIHPGQSGNQKDLPEKRFASRKSAIEKLCNNPKTPEWIRSLRDKAIASLYPWQAIYNCKTGAWDMAKKNSPEAFRVGPNPENLCELAQLLYNHSTELYQQGQLEQALEYLDLLTQSKISSEGLNYQRANILFKLGRIDEAIKSAYEELKLQPGHRSAKAIIRLAQSCPAESTAQTHNDKLAKKLFKIGVEYLSHGDATEAIKHFEEAATNCATLPELHFAMATAYFQLGDALSAKKACEVELNLQPEHNGVKRLLERIEKVIDELNQYISTEKAVPIRGSETANTISNTTSCNVHPFTEPKFSFVMIVLNGMPFIEYSLKSIYDFAHEIIIVEGAVEKCMFAANPDGSSTDGTVEFMRSFPDPQNKIRFIQGKWPEKCEMQNEALKYINGDYVWLIDSDEVYKEDDLKKIKEILKNDQSITQVNFIQDSFWKGLDYILVSNKFFEKGYHSRRIFKYVPGAKFTSHRPPTMVWPGSDKTTEQMNLLDGTTTRRMGIIFYHYSYVLDKQVKQKIELYTRYNWGDKWNIDLLEWYKECFLKWTPANRQEIDSKHPIWTGDINSRTILFTGTHPEVMQTFKDNFIRDKSTSTIEKQKQAVITNPHTTEFTPLERLLKRPQYLKIETTNICNANCSFCMYRFMKRQKGIMSMELFKKVVDDYIAAGGGALTMSPLVGDCLVDTKLLERLKYCRNFNEITHIGFHTNMIGLDRWTNEQILEILDSIDVWNCSIGPNRDVYKDMFGVDQFEQIITNLERLHRLINLIEFKPLVQLNGRAAGGVFETDERLRKLSLGLTGKEIKWTTTYMDWGGLLPDLPRNTKITKSTGYMNKQSPCMKAIVSSVVFCDGRVGLCGCADYDAMLVIGDVNKKKLGDILAGQQRQKMMVDFGKPWLNEYCQKCSFYQPTDLKWIANWIPGTNPHHLEPIRPSLQRRKKTTAKEIQIDTDKYPKISEEKSTKRKTENQTLQAQALLNQGHIVKAMKEFENFLSLSPENIDAHLGRAVCLARLGRLLEAEIEAKKALSKDPKNPGLVRFTEQIHRLKPDLKGDRDIEWGSIKSLIKKIANIQHTGAKLLDFGCGKTAELTRFATQFGYQITAVDMMPLTISLNGLENIHFIQSDFLQQNWTPRNFDLIINCSSIEHAGLAGRYGVVENGPDDDLKIMARMSNIIKPDGKMLLTIPVGLDRVVGALHRVYGRNRLTQLLDGWEIESSCFWIKDENNQWREVDEESALQREPMLAYGLGCFVLHPVIRITSPSDSTLTPTHGYNPETSDHSEDKTNINTATSKTAIPAISKQPHKVLIVKTDGIGDFVIFSGALPYYRKLYPDSHISIIVRECSTELAEACPYIDEVIVNHRESMVYDQNYAAEFIRRIQAAKFDIAICPIYSRDNVSDFITSNSGASERIVSTGNDSNMPFEQISNNNPYFTKLIPAKANCMQETERNIEFLKGLGVIIEKPYKTTVWMKQEHKDFADRLLKELNVESPIVICPFAQYPYKNWTLQKWVKLISHYKDYPIVICGTNKDIQEAEKLIGLTNHGNIHNLCGKTTLMQLAAILAKSELCLSVDSGPAHIAGTVNCPQIVLMGGGHFGRFIPYSPKATIVYNKMDCYGCNWLCKYGSDIRCINTITVEMVEQAANGWLKKAAELPTQDQKAVHKQLEGEQYLVSAIISTYNSENFIRSCLEDLENQTIADKLEIIVVNSGSQQNEEVIVREFQDRYENIKYIKTEERETIYSAWNRAIKIASGKYITNANTDDRHHKNALEIMAGVLDENPDKILVYANQLEINEIDGRRVTVGKRINGKFSRARLFLRECRPGSQPMWRKEVHHAFGYFDENFTIGGDDEFWLRLTQKFGFIYLDEILGERYIGSESLTIRDNSLARTWEALVIHKCYEYATKEAVTIGVTGISEHPVFSNWPEVNIWKQNTKARLENKQTSLHDNIKAKWDIRTNPSPKITIVVVTYNRNKDLLENLYALNKQSEKDFEVIVLDNSGDLSWLRKRADEFNFGLCGIELKINFGPLPAKNISTKFSNGQYIIFLDDDAIADRHLVRNIIKHFENHNISGLRGKVLPKTPTGSKYVPVNYDLGDQIITTACEVSSLSAFKKDVFTDTGGFDELLFGFEGMKLSYRICKAQKKKAKSILYFPDVIVYHDPPSEGPAQTEKVLRQYWMELLTYYREEYEIVGYKTLVRSLYPGYKTLLEINCKNYMWLTNLALYLHKDFPEEAVSWAEKAVALKPYGFKGCHLLGILYKHFGRYDEALVLLERIYEPLHNLTLKSNDEFISPEFNGQNDLFKFYLSTCAKLAQLYTQNKQYDRTKQIYTNLLNNPRLTLSQKQKTEIINELTKLDKTPLTPLIATEKNNAIEPTKSEHDYLVSVIMPAYNATDYIAEAIESVLIQNYNNFELLIINDGSTDNTEEIILGFKDERIRYFSQENRGLAATHNIGIKQCRGEFTIKLDCDDMITPDFIAKHLQEFEEHPEADLIYCDDCLIDENSKPIRVIERPEYTDRKLLIRDLFRNGFPVVPFRTCIRKSVFDKIGFFDENLLVGEGYDMIRRFVKHGLKIHHLNEALYLRRITSNSLSRNYSAEKAKSHFDVVRRFTETFTYDELFPDIEWDNIAPEIRQLHAKCLAAGTYLAIGNEYIKTNSSECSKAAFDQACLELNDCLKMDPENKNLQQLLNKSELIKNRYVKASRQAVSR